MDILNDDLTGETSVTDFLKINILHIAFGGLWFALLATFSLVPMIYTPFENGFFRLVCVFGLTYCATQIKTGGN